MKKVLIGVLSIVIAVTMCFAIVGCGNTEEVITPLPETPPITKNPPSEPEPELPDNFEDYFLGAFTSGTITGSGNFGYSQTRSDGYLNEYDYYVKDFIGSAQVDEDGLRLGADLTYGYTNLYRSSGSGEPTNYGHEDKASAVIADGATYYYDSYRDAYVKNEMPENVNTIVNAVAQYLATGDYFEFAISMLGQGFDGLLAEYPGLADIDILTSLSEELDMIKDILGMLGLNDSTGAISIDKSSVYQTSDGNYILELASGSYNSELIALFDNLAAGMDTTINELIKKYSGIDIISSISLAKIFSGSIMITDVIGVFESVFEGTSFSFEDIVESAIFISYGKTVDLDKMTIKDLIDELEIDNDTFFDTITATLQTYLAYTPGDLLTVILGEDTANIIIQAINSVEIPKLDFDISVTFDSNKVMSEIDISVDVEGSINIDGTTYTAWGILDFLLDELGCTVVDIPTNIYEYPSVKVDEKKASESLGNGIDYTNSYSLGEGTGISVGDNVYMYIEYTYSQYGTNATVYNPTPTECSELITFTQNTYTISAAKLNDFVNSAMSGIDDYKINYAYLYISLDIPLGNNEYYTTGLFIQDILL